MHKEYEFFLSEGTWGGLIEAIRAIRKCNPGIFIHTKLKLVDGIADLGDAKTTANYKFYNHDNPLTIDDTQCANLFKYLGPRIATIVIQSIHAVTDANYDNPSCYAMGTLVDAARNLIKLSGHLPDAEKDIVTSSVYSKVKILDEAERIRRATYQRVGGIPVMREQSSFPFDLPPTNVRLYVEAAEHIVSSVLDLFRDDFPFFDPYVMVDNIESPHLSWLGISIPHHLLERTYMYPSITHETIHALVTGRAVSFNHTKSFLMLLRDDFFLNSCPATKTELYPLNFIMSLPAVMQYHELGRTVSFGSTSMDRLFLLQEIVVEIVDYEISYLGDFERYMEEEWYFFHQYYVNSTKQKLLESFNLVPYILRTFCVKLWHSIRDKYKDYGSKANIDVGFFTEIPHELRYTLRTHVERVEEIYLELNRENGIEHCFPNDLPVLLQNDIQAMSDALQEIMLSMWSIFLNDHMRSKLEVLSKWNSSDNNEWNMLVDNIMHGQINNVSIEYPHLLALEISRRCRKKPRGSPSESTIANCLVINLWNSAYIKTMEKNDHAAG